MNEHILEALDEEIARLRQVRAILVSGKVAEKPRRTLSPKARRAIADAQRKRWAKVHSLKKDVGSVSVAKKETAAG